MREPFDIDTSSEEGVTLVELIIVVFILGIVVTAIFGVMASLTASEQRTQNRVQTQENIRMALADMARDLRSSGTIDAPASVDVADDDAAQWVVTMTTDEDDHVRWRLDRAAEELLREEETTAGVWTVRKRYPDIRNGATNTPFLRYYGSGNQRLETSSATLTDLAACTLRIHMTIRAAAGDATSPYTATMDVGLRNRGSRGVTGC